MAYIDTHTHLYLPEFSDDTPGTLNAVDRAIAAGVQQFVFPNVDLTTIEPMEALAARYPGIVHTAMGLHPTEVKDDWDEVLSRILARFTDGAPYVAVGEIGIDLYWDKTFADAQMQVFDRQLTVAAERNLPVIIHCRDGLEPALEVLQGHKAARGVFHSFGGTCQDVDRIRRTGDFYFGINGIVTFKNSALGHVLPEIGLERILLETDSPYLAPVPKRGKRNESAYLPFIARCIAANIDVDEDCVERATTDNARILFGI